MNKLILTATAAATLGLAATPALADEFGRVISATPVIQQVAVPRQICNVQPVAVQQPNSGAGAVMGAIAGGAIGNAIGQGSGNIAATALGIFGGALLGSRIEGGGASQVQNVQQCSTQTTYENRTVAYNVTYEYAGRQHTVQMPQDPGPTVRLQITPVGAAQPAADPAVLAPAPVTQATIVREVVTVPPTVVVPTYYERPYYYPPVGLSLNFGYVHHGGHRHHRHWR